MAKAIVICFRNPHIGDLASFARATAERMAPDNVSAKPPYISFSEKTLSLIYNPTRTIRTEGFNICLGICDQLDSLFTLKSPLPNGSYALFRVGEEAVEVASDYAASRTIWFYQDEDVFVASTSQRMIIAYLGDLELSKKACGWFLSSGTLGPGLSWDTRIQMVPPRMCLYLDRQSWKLSTDKNSNFNFDSQGSQKLNKQAHKAQLENAVDIAISSLDINPSHWTLALSGGMDSRSILYHLQDENLNAITWGLRVALDLPNSDAQIAKKLAEQCRMSHTYAELDFKEDSFPKMIDRFLCAGEGRIDHLGGYLDGLDLWGNLSASGRGVIRGYDAFGRKPPVTNSFQVRAANNLSVTSDIGIAEIPESYYTSEEDIPAYLNQQEGESLGDWRDRLWLMHRTPIITAALEDIKLSYVEIINPLLNKQVISEIQSLPIELRTNKKIWNSIVSEMFPKTSFARRAAIQEVGQILKLSEVKNFICDTLLENNDSTIFPKAFLTQLVENYGKGQENESLRRKLRVLIIAYAPKILENIIRANLKARPVSYQKLALRTFMILKTKEMLTQDAQMAAQIK